MTKKIGIILVNYKDYATRFLLPCRDSLRAQTYPADLMRVYVVDNAATSETGHYLQDNYPEAHVLSRPDGNYSAANNLGFYQAIADACDYVVTVNMDTEMAPDWLAELVRALELNPEAAIAQSKILLYQKTAAEKATPRLNSLGNIFHFLGFGFTSAYGEPDRDIDGCPEIKGYASGCSFIIRSEVFQAIGGYIEEFYMYHDDVELSLKVRLAGHKIILAPKSIIFHKYEFSRSVGMLYYIERNRYLTLLIFYPRLLLCLILLPGLVMSFGMLFYSLVNGWFMTEMRIYAYFFQAGNYRRIRDERRKIKALSRRSFLSLAYDFSGRIEFQEIANPVLRYVVNPACAVYWNIVKKFF